MSRALKKTNHSILGGDRIAGLSVPCGLVFSVSRSEVIHLHSGFGRFLEYFFFAKLGDSRTPANGSSILVSARSSALVCPLGTADALHGDVFDGWDCLRAPNVAVRGTGVDPLLGDHRSDPGAYDSHLQPTSVRCLHLVSAEK